MAPFQLSLKKKVERERERERESGILSKIFSMCAITKVGIDRSRMCDQYRHFGNVSYLGR